MDELPHSRTGTSCSILNIDDLERHDEVVIDGMGDFEDFRDLVSELLVGIGQALRNELGDLRCVGPVRKLRPPTNVEPGSLDRGNWGDGSAAWNLLLHQHPDPTHRDLLKDVNDWLASKDRLDTGYRLTRKSTVELPAETSPVNWIRFRERLSAEYRNVHRAVDPDRWAKELAAIVANLHHGDADDIETRIKADPGDSGDRDESADENPTEQTNSPEEKLVDAVRERYQFLANLDGLEKGHHPSAVRDLVGAIAVAPMQTKIELVTAGSELPVRTSDIGVGISQLLPVVVAALDPHRPGITAIEQPELHLHPGMQVELGDLFAQPLDDGRVFLLENHSEHLMLRLLRRIEETHSGELPEGKPALKPDQVSVVFLEQVDGEVQATRLRIDETGEFIDRWPRACGSTRLASSSTAGHAGSSGNEPPNCSDAVRICDRARARGHMERPQSRTVLRRQVRSRVAAHRLAVSQAVEETRLERLGATPGATPDREDRNRSCTDDGIDRATVGSHGEEDEYHRAYRQVLAERHNGRTPARSVLRDSRAAQPGGSPGDPGGRRPR